VVTTEYLNEDNKHLLFLLPGQSLSPRAFWDFELPEGKTHAKIFFESGLDIIMFDPAGYGKSPEFYQYDRVGYADQIEYFLNTFVNKDYVSKTIFAFSTSTAVALIAAERKLFDKVIIHSPSIRNDPQYYVKHGVTFETNIEKLKTNRIEKISDRLIPNKSRIPNWEQRILDVIQTTSWKVPAKPVYDVNNYWVDHGNNGFNQENITAEILAIRGQYDYECKTGGYELFMQMFPKTQEIVIPNSTHFSMWEKESAKTRAAMLKFCLTNIQK
jgi:pimeloyl-ACP methyl ester carboxylesterase